VNGGETATPAPAIEYGYSGGNETLKGSMGGQALKWGILSLAFSCSGCLSLLGFIFSFIAKSRARAYEQTFGVLEGKAKVGRILGKVGFGVGLGMTIYVAVVFVLAFLGAMADSGVMM
jgi:hypothetical protein